MILLIIPINILLQGCESWALHVSLLNKLEVFLDWSIRRILGVTMTQVKEEIITNETICQRGFDIQKIQNQVAKRQPIIIGKVTHNSDEKLPTKLLMEWRNNKRRFGGVLQSNKKTLVQIIALVLPRVD